MDLLGRDLASGPYLTIGAADLTCAQVAPDGDAAALLSAGAIEYATEWRERVAGSRLFWGPYLALAAGVYLLAFGGRVEGELTLDFAHRGGNVVLKTVRLTDFAVPVCLVLTEPVVDFEMQAHKNRALRALRLEAIAFHRVYNPPVARAG